MRDGENLLIMYKSFYGDLEKIAGKLFDSIGLFQVNQRYISPISNKVYEETVTFVLGCFGEEHEGAYWFVDPSDDLNKFIVDRHGNGKWYSEIICVPIEETENLCNEAAYEYVEAEKTDRVLLERKSTLRELIYMHDISVPEIEPVPLGVKRDED